MSNTLLESLWARVDANIGARIKQISDLLTQALSAKAEVAADASATAAHRAHVDDQVSAIDTAFTESVPPYLQPNALSRDRILNSPHVDARLEGLWDVTSSSQDVAPILNAAADRARAENRPLYIPAPKNRIGAPDGTSAYSISQTVDLRYLDVYCEANIVVRHNNSPGIIVGDNSTRRNGRTIRLGNVKHASTGYFDWDWAHPAVRVIGLMSAEFTMSNCSLLELYADGDITADRAIAYNSFRLQRVNHLRLHGLGRGWINENTFYGGSYNRVTVRGDYSHDANTWFKPSIEGDHALFDFQCGYTNSVIEARSEGGAKVRFSERAHRNYLSSLYLGNVPIIHAGFNVIEDLGKENIVTSVASQNHAPHTVFSLSSSTFLTDTASELVRENSVTPTLPGGKLRLSGRWDDWIDTGELPLENDRDPNSSNKTMMPTSRISRFSIFCDQPALFIYVYFYDAQGELIRADEVESMYDYAGWRVSETHGYYFSSARVSGLPIVITNPDAKYMRLRFTSGGTDAEARLIDHVTLTAYSPEGSVPAPIARMKELIYRPAFGTAQPTKGLAHPGATIQGVSGLWRSASRVDTTVAAVNSESELALDSVSGIQVGDVIGVLMPSGETHWTSVAGKSGSVVTLESNPPSAVSVGAAVGTTRWVYVPDVEPEVAV